jgi:hypothetical protein
MTDLDAAIFAIMLLVGALVALAAYAGRQRQHAAVHEKRGDELWMWAELHRIEADAARARLRDVERRHVNLQTLYADLVRQRLAGSTWIVIADRRWKQRDK